MYVITHIIDGKKAYFKNFEIFGIPNFTYKKIEAIIFKYKAEAVYYNKQYVKGTVEKIEV